MIKENARNVRNTVALWIFMAVPGIRRFSDGEDTRSVSIGDTVDDRTKNALPRRKRVKKN